MEAQLLLCLALSLVGGLRAQVHHDAYDYCDAELKLCEVFSDHTMCKYPVPGLSPRCTPAVHEPLSATEKKRILFWHNKFRSNVANGAERQKNRKLPTSSNMRQIYWDRELEMIATRWAEQCASTTNPNGYDKCRNTKRFQVSQNVGMRMTNGTSIDKQAPQIVVSWFKENKDFDPSLVDNYNPVGDEKVSAKQFINIIWADTHAIGCARVIFQENLPSVDTNTTLWTIERLICNYGPGGNQRGKPVYKRGVSCENCPEGTHCSLVFPGLCAVQSVDKTEGQQTDAQDGKDEAKTPKQELRSNEKTSDDAAETDATPPEEFPEDVDETEERNEEGDEEVGEGLQDCEEGACTRRGAQAHPGTHFKEIIKAPKPRGGPYLVKAGVYINGKCHCSDIQRSRARSRWRAAPSPFLGLPTFILTNLLVSYF